ncbi:DUF1501 domain-containing protein [Alcaligenaceae bacterium B3P038]|nr:DUF1501 domain-containing protein [Alcaligenaceae bacterium B3P038]
MHRRSRRTFLKQATALGLTGVAAPLALNLSAMSEAAAQSASDYKAIVCVFLYGGNDPYNTLVPYDAERFARYAALRTDIGLARDALAATALHPKTPHASGDYALAPSLAALKPLFDAGQLAVQLNTGPLIQPTTKAQYIAASVPLPPKLFSHNDQQAYWQALAQEGSATGWGGRLSDLFAANNGASTFTAVTAGGSTQLLAGRHVGAYRVTPQGSTRIELLSRDLYGSPECTALLRELTTASRTHLLEHQLAQTVTRSIKADTQLSAALDGVKAPGTFESPLARQLEIVARMIAARDKLSVKRQVFFVSQNGYDNHDGLRTLHPALLRELGDAMAVFQGSLGTLGVANQVTTFTASEFGRTITSNGNGSDHGWGGHHFIMGGAVRGGRFYGEHPELNIEGPGFVDHGRMLPTTSVEQLASTLGAWFGASAGDLDTVFPNLRGFSDKRLAFI